MPDKKKYILPVFIPFQGCRHRCLYCDQSLITGVDDLSVKRSVRKQLAMWLSRRAQWDEAAFYGGTFTALSKSLRSYLYEIVSPLPVRLSTCPDSITDEFLSEIDTYRIRTVELGVQSLSERVLSANRRFYSAADVVEAFSRLRGKADIVIQLMVGMYGEGRGEFLYTCRALSAVRAGYARIYPLLVFRDTALGEKYVSGEFIPLEGAECLIRAAWLYIVLEAQGTRVIRIGLPQPSAAGEIVGGYRHNAWGDLVRTLVIYGFAECCHCLPDVKGSSGYKAVIRRSFTLPAAQEIDTMQKVARKLMECYQDGEAWLNSDKIRRFAEAAVLL